MPVTFLKLFVCFARYETKLIQRGKEVRKMNYEKPTVVVLGEASVVIQGSKTPIGDNELVPGPDAFELED
jgi:hypothetical protein